ncbi:MAG: CvpA family protein [Tannerella sp.]|jgi:membrane protein required for colicin V production|nr:CvpA family protein [Tannerella sp.]
MSWLDITVLCLAGAGLIKGLKDGMIKQVVALGALIVGIYLCTGVASWVQSYLLQFEWLPKGAVGILSYFLGFVLIVGVILLAGNIVDRLIDITPLSILNHLAGGLVGVIMMALFLSLVFNIIEMFDTNAVFISREIKVESRFYVIIRDIIPTLFPGKLFPAAN